MANPPSVPQNFSTTLNVGGGIDNSQTTGIILQSVSGLPTDGGILCFDWSASLDPAVAEYIEYTGLSGNTLTGVIRGQEGFSAKAHSNGCTIVGVISQAHIKRLRDKLTGNDAVAIQDPNGNEVLKSGYVTSAVNEVTVKNAATGNSPELSATGTDSNIDLKLTPKGAGNILVNGGKKDLRSVVTDGATVTFDLSLANVFEVVLGGNRTLAFSNIPVIDATKIRFLLLRLTQDGTGSRTVTWPTTAVAVITMTIAAPGVVTLGLDIPTGTPIKFTTTGALPTGVTAGTTYYWIRQSATTGNLATSLANAQAGTTITTSGTQSGVHSAQILIRWSGGGTEPTLTTGKYRTDEIGIKIIDSVDGIIEGCVVNQDM